MTINIPLPTLAEVCQGPLTWRVPAATRLLQECSPKDTPGVYRTIVQSLFGVSGHSESGELGWWLNQCTKSHHPTEFNLLYDFLCSSGPLLTMALKQANDPCMIFEFPLTSLPMQTQASISEGSCNNPLYSGKLLNPGPGKAITHVMLNAFEFYMYNFAYYLVHIGNAGVQGSLVYMHGIYPALTDEYLRVYLPCDASLPPSPLPQAVSYAMPFASRFHSSPHTPNMMGSTPHGSFGATPTIVRGGPYQTSGPQQSTYSSQVVAQILIEFWVNQCQGSPSPHRAPQSPRSGLSSPRQQQSVSMVDLSGSWLYGANHQGAPQPSPDRQPLGLQGYYIIPGVGVSTMADHMRMVRMVIKHLQYFANSVKPVQPSPLDKLRSSVHSMFRKSFYQMFVQLLSKWPLDSSFRLLMEAWLAYIQPWRYTDLNGSPDDADLSILDWYWQKFVAENLLFYSSIMTAVIPRLLRLDLSNRMNANVFYRLSRLFSDPNLVSMLHHTEECVQTLPNSFSDASAEQNRLSPHTISSMVRHHCNEVEFVGHYSPLFSAPNQEMMKLLLCNVKTAEQAILKELEDLGHINSSSTMSPPSTPPESLWSQLSHWLSDQNGGMSPSNRDSQIQELLQIHGHLEAARHLMANVFQISALAIQASTADESPSKLSPIVPHQEFSQEKGAVLTDEGRRQLISGLRRRDLKYEGDPDLRPIGVGELALLVRWLYILSQHLNNKYHKRFHSGYYSGGVVGMLWRCVLCPPMTVYEYHKGRHAPSEGTCSASFPERRARHLPPRVTFRRMAHKQTLCIVIALFLVLRVLFGVSVFSQVLYIVFPLCLLYFIYHSFSTPLPDKTPLTNSFEMNSSLS